MIVDGEEEWEVEDVLDSRRRYGRLQYKVKWLGDEETTWQPAEDFEHAQDLDTEFHQRYPQKPRPVGA